METFAFIIHPLSIQDVAKKYRLATKVSPKVVAGLLKRRRPFAISEITGVESETGVRATGWFIAVPLLPRQILELEEDYVIGKILKGCRVAEKQGARIVGLGAFTALVGDAGRRIAEEADIAVTTGNSYTVVTAVEGTRRAAAAMGRELSECSLAVVGATGSIGRACAALLAPDVAEVCLLGRDSGRLAAVAEQLGADAGSDFVHSTDVRSSVRNADIIVSVSSSADVLIEPEDIKAGAVICDVARPRDVSPRVHEARDDVLVIDGGVVRVPGHPEFNFDFGVPPGHAEACIAETMILALEGRYEDYTIGREISLERIKEIGRLADKHGFRLAGFRRFERVVAESEIERIRENAQGGRVARASSFSC